MSDLMHVLSDPKAAATVSAATTASGVSTWFDLIPNDIGKLATVVGMFLSIILITYWAQKTYFEVRRNNIELRKLEKEEDAP